MPDDWLDRLKSEGQLDSSGYFSLDPERARRLLASFTLQFPRQYLQHLVQAAVMAGATSWSLERAGHRLLVEFDGARASTEELSSLIDALVLEHFPPERRWLRWLALGLLGASREALDVWVQNDGGDRFRVGPRGVDKSSPSQRAPVSTSIEIVYKQSLKSLFFGADTRLERFALSRCCFAPLQLKLGSRLLSEICFLEGTLPTLIQGKAALGPSVTFGQLSFAQRATDQPHSVAMVFSAHRSGIWLMVGGTLSLLTSRSFYDCRAVIAFEEMQTDLNGQLTQDEAVCALSTVRQELERALADAAEQSNEDAWSIIRTFWDKSSDSAELMRRPLLPASTGERHPLGTLRQRRQVYSATGFSEANYRGQPVFDPEVLKRLEGRVKQMPLCRLPAHGWVRCGPRMGRLGWLPGGKYIVQSNFDYSGVEGRCGLTHDSSPPMPVLCYAQDQPIEIEPEVALPAGLHVVVKAGIGPDRDFAPALVPLYQALLSKHASQTIARYHLIEYLAYVTRCFEVACEKLGRPPGSPFDAMLGGRAEGWVQRFELRFAVEEFAHAAFLPKGRTPAQARADWPKVAAALTLEQALKLRRFFRGEDLADNNFLISGAEAPLWQ
jgi:hypothetical protein